MSSRKIATLIIVSALAGFAGAPAAQAAAPTLDVQAIGITQAALDYCGKVDPSTKVRLEAKLADLQKGANEDQLARLRRTENYRKAYDSVSEFTAKIEGERNGHRFCSEPAGK